MMQEEIYMWGKRGGCYADLVWVWWGGGYPKRYMIRFCSVIKRGEYIFGVHLKRCMGYIIVTLKFEYFVGLAVGVQNGNVNTSLSRFLCAILPNQPNR